MNTSFAKFEAVQVMSFGLNSWRRTNLNSDFRARVRRVTMHRNNTSTVRSVVSELQISLRNILARYGTFGTHIQTAHQSTVAVLLQKALTVLFSKNWAFRTTFTYRTVSYCHAWLQAKRSICVAFA